MSNDLSRQEPARKECKCGKKLKWEYNADWADRSWRSFCECGRAYAPWDDGKQEHFQEKEEDVYGRKRRVYSYSDWGHYLLETYKRMFGDKAAMKDKVLSGYVKTYQLTVRTRKDDDVEDIALRIRQIHLANRKDKRMECIQWGILVMITLQAFVMIRQLIWP